MSERARAVDRDAFLPVKIGLSRIEAAAFIGVKEMTFDYMVSAGDMPQARRFGDVDRWLRPELAMHVTLKGCELEQRGNVIGFGDFVKIGFTTNLESRLQSLQTYAPVKLTLYQCFFGPPSEERRLHERFADLRLKGEWFRFDQKVRDWLLGEVCDD